jgi:mannose-1-phosphate guanylyltransferase
MLPLVDRPFVQHVIEFLAEQGVREFDLVLSHLPEVVEHHLGDGSRWGCRFTYHLARVPSRPYGVLRHLRLDRQSPARLLFGHADCLPAVRLCAKAGREVATDTWLFTARQPRRRGVPGGWTGWGVMSASELQAIPPDMQEEDLPEYLLTALAKKADLRELNRFLSVKTPAEMLATQRAVLDRHVPGLMLQARQKHAGVWVSSRARVSSTAELCPPVFVGADCLVGCGARLGPHVAVGAGCILDGRCCLTNAVVLPGTFVGKGVVLEGAVVDRDLAVNARDNSFTTFSDPLILGSVGRVSWGRLLSGLLTRSAALALLLLFAPLFVVTALVVALRRGRVFSSRRVVRLPVAHVQGQWPTYRLYSFARPLPRGSQGGEFPRLGHLFLDVLPGLFHVLWGQVHFVGVPPRSPEEVRELPEQWRTLYLNTKGGLFSPVFLMGPGQTVEDQFAADADCAAYQSWREDMNVMADYLFQALTRPLRKFFTSKHGPPRGDHADEDVPLDPGGTIVIPEESPPALTSSGAYTALPPTASDT